MYPNTNYYYQQPTQSSNYSSYIPQQLTTTYQGLKGRPVSSFEEARAITIDFDGSTFFFPDLANRRIYTKQINMDGTASLFVYELREQPIETSSVSNNENFITREEFEQVIKELRENYAPRVSESASQPVTTAAKIESGLSKLF